MVEWLWESTSLWVFQLPRTTVGPWASSYVGKNVVTHVTVG